LDTVTLVSRLLKFTYALHDSFNFSFMLTTSSSEFGVYLNLAEPSGSISLLPVNCSDELNTRALQSKPLYTTNCPSAVGIAVLSPLNDNRYKITTLLLQFVEPQLLKFSRGRKKNWAIEVFEYLQLKFFCIYNIIIEVNTW